MTAGRYRACAVTVGIVAGLFALPAMAAPATAPFGYQTAGQLAERCADGSPASTGYCFAYIAAVHDSVRAYEIWLSQREFCPPPGVVQADLRRAFLGYVAAYPASRTGQAASVIVVALKETYPCGATGAPSRTPVAP
jgi:hypothetical protein